MRFIFYTAFLMVCSSLLSQNKYWNDHTKLIPWRIPLVADRANIVYEDLNGDGKPDIIKTTILDGIPILWIDDDGDMEYGDTEGDTDNDCLLVDLNRDGIFAGPEDLCVDWVDTDEDGIADMQFVIFNGKKEVRGGFDYKTDFICVIDKEKDDIKNFIDWNKLIPRCWERYGHSNFLQDYHGNTLLLKMHASSFRVDDTRYNCENPFIFYDHDNDHLTEMAVRMMDVPYARSQKGESKRFEEVSDEIDIIFSKRITWASIAWDVDNDNGQGNEFDLDMTLHFAGKGFDYSDQVHRFKNLRGLPEADHYFYDPRWRQMEELVYPDEHVAYDMTFQKGEWNYCWLVFDEDDDCNRWERVEMYYPYDVFKVGAGAGGVDSHKQADATGDRGEFDQDNSGKGKLYLSPIDGRIHLFGAEWGVWRIDQNASYFQGYGGLYDTRTPEKRLYPDPESWATLKYTDTDDNGFFDLVEYDLDGDTTFEERISLFDLGIDDKSALFDPASMDYNAVQNLFAASVENTWKRAEEAMRVATRFRMNTSWYAFWKQPRTLFEKYAYGYWLNFYIYKDLKYQAQLDNNRRLERRLDQAYYSGNWDELLEASYPEISNMIPLSGQWKVRTDLISQSVRLPGSLAENGVGEAVMDSVTDKLSEPTRFVGKASYERDVYIPASWMGKLVELFIERSKVTEVFVNGVALGTQSSVSAPHVYQMTDVFRPGRNQLMITVDNTKSLLPLGGSHAYSEHTQTNWNGILGDFYLRCRDEVSLEDIRIDASVDGTCSLHASIRNELPKKKTQTVEISVYDPSGKKVFTRKSRLGVQPGIADYHITFKIQNPLLWDEYHPHLYSLKVSISENEKQEQNFGFRDFRTSSTQFTNNDRIVFLRGKQEGGVFPLTGYPSMYKEDWSRYFSVVKSYGINHVRYHSWTPPKAAFEAADEKGVFLQPELPLWGRYGATDTLLIRYMKSEGEKIMKAYGNHPSFVLFTLGNELEGDTAVMAQVVDHLRKIDDRHLYALGSNNFYWDPQTHPTEDFFVAMRHGKKSQDYSTDLRGSFSFADSDEGGIINCRKPTAESNFDKANKGLNKPAVGHETGQYQLFPNFDEMEKYTGVMQPRNFAVFKTRLEKAGMLSQSKDFLKASGALSALCYREEIEMALRTPDFGGFQLLDLQDYPGQGTALVGVLDAFLESKDVISREKWVEFCNDIVPLAIFPKYCWSNNEVLAVEIKIAHYGKESMEAQNIRCSLVDEKGSILFERDFLCQKIEQGKLNRIAALTIPLHQIDKPKNVSIVISLPQTDYKNSWNIWVYPFSEENKVQEGYINGVLVSRNKQHAEDVAEAGTPVLYIPDHADIKDNSVGGLFITDFWNYAVFKRVAENMKVSPSPGTLGILTNPGHKIFDTFPTDFHTNWQWWNIIKHSRPVILDDMPKDYFPIVQVIDNVERNHKLGLIYERPSAKANMLICASDLFACWEEPEVKALFYSLINYLQPEKKDAVQ